MNFSVLTNEAQKSPDPILRVISDICLVLYTLELFLFGKSDVEKKHGGSVDREL